MARYYDDDLKLFLVEALKKVDYLSELDEVTLCHLAFKCKGEIIEKDCMLYSAGDHEDCEASPEEQQKMLKRHELAIIFDGKVELFTKMDGGKDFSIEYLPRGSVLNAHNLLPKRNFAVNARCV